MDIKSAIKETGQEFLAQSMNNTEQAFAQAQVEPDEPLPQPVDVWQQRRDAQANLAPTKIHGARPKMQLDMAQLLNGPVKDAYKKTVDDGELLRESGDTERARILEQQYMQDYYYPLIDALVRMNSRDEVLASQDALEALDALAIVPGGGDTTGYASTFVAGLYEPTDNVYHTDAWVGEQMRRIRTLSADHRTREAAAVARKLQTSIDAGEHSASPEDYELIQRVAIRV